MAGFSERWPSSPCPIRCFDRAPEAVEDWVIAVWLSAREEGLHDTTVAEPLMLLAATVH